ncbi:hypothetical protein SRB5_21900 [Streptomyces sp. RB5]|uniref:Response regulatory domain-containing protein n=1 Tax=Streptomyces smaragdinus TaxID=2585196 RepID=A0A7K0CF15_9ACTN|nr:hypothetical protein [Streptomyces smaragdinus]
MRLLLVEDEHRLARSLARGLTAEGFAVDVVHTGTDGLHRATTLPYDLILLDNMLPGLNGYAARRGPAAGPPRRRRAPRWHWTRWCARRPPAGRG